MTKTQSTRLFGGVEAGGTKFVCAIGTGSGEIMAETRFPTSTPETTLEKLIQFFKENDLERLTSVGIGSFGPIDPNPKSPTYGFITNTPKPGWAFYDFAGAVREALNVPVGFDTDVNAAAFGEFRWGAGKGLDTLVYLTVGTGIGGGAIVERKILHGLIHPEMGHIRIPHDFQDDPFPGICPFHGDCIEGLACGPALAARWGQPAETLPEDHPAWNLEAKYLAYALVNYSLILSPQRIILGGGVMNNKKLFSLIQEKFINLLNNYVDSKKITEDVKNFIVAPGLGSQSGVKGALALAKESAEN